MKIVGVGGQARRDCLYDASGTIASGSAAQLVLARSQSRTFFLFQNLHASASMFLEFGAARATATISGGVVTSTSITNAGFGYSKPPVIRFVGGGFAGNSSYLGLAQPNGESPQNVATGVAVMTGSAPNQTLASITITNGGSNYAVAPFVEIENSDLDPIGAAVPASGAGVLVPAGGSLRFDASFCPTDQVAVFCATISAAFTCRWTP